MSNSHGQDDASASQLSRRQPDALVRAVNFGGRAHDCTKVEGKISPFGYSDQYARPDNPFRAGVQEGFTGRKIDAAVDPLLSWAGSNSCSAAVFWRGVMCYP
jgi:hypothetical protein